MEVSKYFSEQAYAEDLLRGNVWIGTLEGFRKCEQSRRGDPNEGIKQYHSGRATGDENDPALRMIAERLGFYIEGSIGGTFDNCHSEAKVHDAFVYCTATKEIRDPRELQAFGSIRILITDIELFAHRVDGALRKHFGMAFAKHMGPVSYVGATYQGCDPDPGRNGFVKDPDFVGQHEYRLLWTGTNRAKFVPFLLPVPRIAALCSLAC